MFLKFWGRFPEIWMLLIAKYSCGVLWPLVQQGNQKCFLNSLCIYFSNILSNVSDQLVGNALSLFLHASSEDPPGILQKPFPIKKTERFTCLNISLDCFKSWIVGKYKQTSYNKLSRQKASRFPDDQSQAFLFSLIFISIQAHFKRIYIRNKYQAVGGERSSVVEDLLTFQQALSFIPSTKSPTLKNS